MLFSIPIVGLILIIILGIITKSYFKLGCFLMILFIPTIWFLIKIFMDIARNGQFVLVKYVRRFDYVCNCRSKEKCH